MKRYQRGDTFIRRYLNFFGDTEYMFVLSKYPTNVVNPKVLKPAPQHWVAVGGSYD